MKARNIIAVTGKALVAASLGAALPGAAGTRPAGAAAGCAAPPQAAFVAVELVAPEVKVDRALSRRELAKEYGHGHAAGSIVFGLTAGRVKSELAVHSLTQQRADGVFCGWPARLAATVAYDGPIAVHLVRDLRPGSCQHEAVLDHEMEHVAVFREALPVYEAELTKALEAALADGRFPVTGRDRGKVQAETGKRFEAAFEGAVAAAEAERHRRNARLDTPQSYQRTRDRCRSW